MNPNTLALASLETALGDDFADSVKTTARDYLVAASALALLTRRFPGEGMREVFREAAKMCHSLWRSHEFDSVDSLLYDEICGEYYRIFNEPLEWL